MTAANPERRWYRLHVSTYVVLLFAAATLVMANVPGNRREFHYFVFVRRNLFREKDCLHGWPLTYLRRTAGRLGTAETSIWRLSERVTQFRPLALACDALIALAILVAVATAYEWWRRRRESLWRFSLRELIVVLTAFALLFAILYRQDRQRLVEQQVVAQLQKNHPFQFGPGTWEQCGPDWIWEIVPAERFPMFRRLIELGPNPTGGGGFLPRRVRGQPPEAFEAPRDWLVGDGQLKPLSRLTRLKRLNLDYSADATEIVWLAGLRNLTHLSLACDPVDDAHMKYLAGLTRLEYLGLGMTRITDAGLEQLSGMSRLESLDLGSTRITDAGLVYLEGMTRLKVLDLTNTATGDAGLSHLRGLTNLEESRLWGTDVTDAGLVYVKGLRNLRELDLSHTLITDAGLMHLERLTNLERLDLSDTSVRGPGLRYLTNLKRLEVLRLCARPGGSYRLGPRPELSDEDLMHLAALKNLKHLELSGRDVSATAVAALREALPELETYRHW